MNRFARIGAGVILVSGLTACGTLYTLDITAVNDPRHELGEKYVILSGSPDLHVRSSEFADYAAQVERALAEKGYVRVSEDNLHEADLGIYLAAEIGEPGKRFHRVSTAMYETPQGEYVSAVIRPSGDSSQTPPPGGAGGVNPVITLPPDQLVGYEESPFATTVYTKHLSLIAIDIQQYIKDIASVGRDKAVPREVWSIDVETTGQPSNLGEVIPVMIAAGQPYIGSTTDDTVQVKMNGSDKRIAVIQGE